MECFRSGFESGAVDKRFMNACQGIRSHLVNIERVGQHTNSVTGDSNAFLSSVNLESLNSKRSDFVSPSPVTSFNWVLNEVLARKSEVLGHSTR
jgi:hypothetical protein